MTPRHFIATALAAASFLFAPAAVAQQDGDMPQIAAEDVSEDQVASFVDAMMAVQGVRQEYMPQIQAAESEDDRQALSQEADAAARSAVSDVPGISPDEYLAIAMAAQDSEKLVERINGRIAVVQEESQTDGATDQ